MGAVFFWYLREQCNLTQACICTSQTVLKRQCHNHCRVYQYRLDGVIVPPRNVEERLRAVGRNIQFGVRVRVMFILQRKVITMEIHTHTYTHTHKHTNIQTETNTDTDTYGDLSIIGNTIYMHYSQAYTIRAHIQKNYRYIYIYIERERERERENK